MDRSNSTSSNRSSTGVFAYQAKLLERAPSLSRASSQNRGILSPTGVPGSPAATRRWAPTHRVGNSLDGVRSRWEARVRAENSDDPTHSSELANQPTGGEFESDKSRDSTPTRFRSSEHLPLNDSPTPPYLKRHTVAYPPPASATEPPASLTPPHSRPTSPELSPTKTSYPTTPTRSFATPSPNRVHLPSNSPFPSPSTSAVKQVGSYAPSGTRDERPEVLPVTSRIRRANTLESLIPNHTGSSTSSTTSSSSISTSRTVYDQSHRPSPDRMPVSSVMTPKPYRSAYMANKKSGGYGDVGIGRRLGRHLPRIASGDGNDDLEEERKREEQKREERQREEQKLQERKQAEFARRERREERIAARLREMEREQNLPPPSPVSPVKEEPSTPGMSGANDVQGIPGRLRLSRDVHAPASPTFPAPSARLRIGLWADTQRHLLQAYEYLCHVGEAQQWIEGCLGEELGFGVVEMEDGLRNGIVLVKLARVWEGNGIWKGESFFRKIYDKPGLEYRHSDNINHFLDFVRRVGLPESFIFVTLDLYGKKNFPKVVYCIHALSHLLSRRGMAERIGNLLGRLQFSDDQLTQTQRGLTAAGISIPNFGNVGKELAKEINEEPEIEVETEDERRDRLLLENVDSIILVQTFARGYLTRKAMAAQRLKMRLAERYIVKLQGRCRGVLTRQSIQEQRKEQADLTPWVKALQAVSRGALARRAWRARLTRIRLSTRFIVKIQAQARGVLIRRRYNRLKAALRGTKFSVVKLQSIARARVARKVHKELTKKLETPKVMKGIVGLQAAARGVLARWRADAKWHQVHSVEVEMIGLQAYARAALVRRRLRNQLAKLDDAVDIVVRIQAAARAFLARKRLLTLIRGLRRAAPVIVGLQARARANLARRKHHDLNKALAEVKVVASVGSFQARARAALSRKRHQEQQKRLEFCEPDIIGLQAAARAALVRNSYWSWVDYLHRNEIEATNLQALLRGALQRRKFREKMEYYRANLSKVVKIQSLFRAKEQREQYRQLTLGKNVNVGTIKNFVHLLDDSEADFEDEIEVERLRKRVVEGIRENQALETDVNELDVKIALVVQNVKSFEELIKARRRHGADSVAAHAARASVLAAHGDPFAGPNTLDHATKRKLELYQQLFYLLQTRGEYLARLFFRLSRIEIPEKTKRMTERVVLTLFGYGQERREEYLLLKLFQMSIHEEIKAAPAVKGFVDGHPMYVNIAIQYVRPKQVTYVRDTLQAIIREVAEQDDLDLETNPVVVYQARINVEEMRTGKVSTKRKDVEYHVAVEDPETRVEFIRNLQRLQALTKDFLNVIIGSTRKIPFGLRCLARETLLALRVKFPDSSEEALAAAIGKLVYYRYINPAIVTPETFDIVSRTLASGPRKNLAEISNVLTQITSGQEFTLEDNLCLTPLNSFVSKAIKEFADWFLEVADVPDAETYFHAHEFLDVTVQPKPIYISPNEVYSMHTLLAQHLDYLITDRNDPLRLILTELDGVPHLGSDELKDARDRAITLELTNRFATVKDPHAEEKALWVHAKRAVLAVLRVQPGKDLVESLVQPIADEHEEIWEDIVDRELATDRMRSRKRRMPSTTGMESAYRLQDIQSLSFREVKAAAIEYLLDLERRGKVSRADGYQGILNAIAGDVRSKHRKRLQRQHELESMQEALRHLAERKKYFEEQIESYHNYVETAMNTMQRGKVKKRFVMPFTKQYFHLRDLQRSGKSPQFGSFKYSAQDLCDKGILLSIDQISPRQFDRIHLVISSNKVGVFTIEVTNTNNGVSTLIASQELKMEDLLQAQFENRVSLALFDGMAKMNLNLLLYQINKKFYV